MRIVIVVIVLMACAGGVASLFWKQDLKYSLPTPVPADYKFIAVGESVTLPSSLSSGKSYFFHFYNPDCPCSRFNARHIKSLLRSYNDSTAFIIVVPSSEFVEKVKDEFGDDLIIKADTDGAIAQACGVYSTPQAAIIDSNSKLFYRGNYNQSRYCTTRASNFAELSLIALLNRQPPPSFGLLATQSYGCELSKTAELELF